MPEPDYAWLPKAELLDFDELERLAGVLAATGVGKVRLTGGEPLLRRDLATLVTKLAALGLSDLALTTNGVLLPQQGEALRAAGLKRVTVSIDTLQPDRFEHLTRRRELRRVVEGIRCGAALFDELKLDVVLMRGVNDDEIFPLLDFAADHNAELRFIEYMDVGGATRWTPAQVVSRADILDAVAQRGGVTALSGRGSAPAERFELPSGQIFGIIASTTTPFCSRCDRLRLTADGVMYSCLYAERGLDLKQPLRDGASDTELEALVASFWRQRRDRGAEQRVALPNRGVLVPVTALRRDPHREMHTRGG